MLRRTRLRRRWGRALLCGVLSVVALNSSRAQNAIELPKIEGESLAGTHVVLPEAASGKVALLILGFTRASKTATRDWGQRVWSDFSNQPSFMLFQLPVLEDAPRFVRGMIISGLRKGVPQNMRDHFVPIVSGEADLKSLVHYKETDDAYLVVLDRSGKVVREAHGPLNDAAYSQIRREIETALK
jgi:hypothetical protein